VGKRSPWISHLCLPAVCTPGTATPISVSFLFLVFCLLLCVSSTRKPKGADESCLGISDFAQFTKAILTGSIRDIERN
jgi:hypothetical protein